jgi:outer membrane immunogenic protein
MKLISNLSAKIEYDFIYLGPTAMNLGSNRGSQDVEHTLHLVKAGLNWRFGDDYLLARR